MKESALDRSLKVHAAAVKETVVRVERLPDDQWGVPMRDGKWSPAEIIAHLNSSYGIVTTELRGGQGMKIRVPLIRRWVLRLAVLPGILAGRGFPKGAVAPRETRPGEVVERDAAIAMFRRAADEFEEAARNAPNGRKITHAYFGSGSVPDGVLLCARHVEHHARQLPDGR